MAQIFISHSSRDEDLVNKFVDLLETGLGLHGSDAIFASSIPGRDIEMGDVNHNVKRELVDAKLAIFILSPNFYASQYCIAEMGAAWITDKKIFIFTVPPLDRGDVKAVFEGRQSEQLHSNESLDKLATVIGRNGIERDDPGPARWNKKRDEFIEWMDTEHGALAGASKPRIEDVQEWRDRGRWSASIVDSTLYIGSSGYVDVNVKGRIIVTIEHGLVLPTPYAYLTETGFHNWLRLTEDASYTYYRDSLDLIRGAGPTLAATIKETLRADKIDVISLGPGDGAKDTLMLQALSEHFDASDLHYYPFDVNPSMISRAMKTVAEIDRLQQIQVKAILADFDSLPQFSEIYEYRSAPNLLMLLGNTLGNLSNERTFLEEIHQSAMFEGDLLLVDVRRGGGQDSAYLRSKAHKEFDFGPLEMLRVPYDPDKLRYVAAEKGISTVPNTDTILATYEAMTYEGKEYRDVKLGQIHEYDPAAVRSTCEEIGFAVIRQDEQRLATSLLLQKK
jgi:hypothetical protein